MNIDSYTTKDQLQLVIVKELMSDGSSVYNIELDNQVVLYCYDLKDAKERFKHLKQAFKA